MTDRIFITVTQRGHEESTELLGPFQSIEEGKRLVTDNVTCGIDGNETKYTFTRVTNDKITNFEVGYILLRDPLKYDLWKKSEHFPNV